MVLVDMVQVDELTLFQSIEQAQAALSDNKVDEVFLLLKDFPAESIYYEKSLEIKGFAANAKKDWRSASDYWVELSKYNPNRLGPIRQAISAFMMSGEFESGLAYSDSILKDTSELNAVQVERMRLLSALGRTQDIKEIIDDLTGHVLGNRDFSATIQLARWRQENADHESAIAMFEKAREFEPSRTDPELYLGRLYYNLKRYDAAKETWKTLIDDPRMENANLYEPHIFLARIAVIENDDVAAEMYYQAANAEDQKRVEPYRSLVNLALRKRDKSRAMDIANLYAERFPDIEDAKLLLANLAESQEDHEKVNKLWHDIFKQFGYTETATLRASEYYVRQERFSDALNIWSKFEKNKHPTNTSRYQRANILSASKQSEAALDVLTNELKPFENYHENGMLLQANLLHKLGRRSEAGKLNERATKLFPRTNIFWVNAVRYYRDIDSEEAVEALISEALEHFPSTTSKGLLSLAQIYAAAEQYNTAAAYYDQMLELDPTEHRGRKIYMRMLLQRGLYRDAEPHALVLRQENWREQEATKVLAQMARIRLEGLDKSQDKPTAFQIFDRISERRPVRELSGSRRTVMLTSSLGSGGAERQVAYTAIGLPTDEGIASLTVVGQDLNKETGRGFFSKDVESTEHSLVDLADDDAIDIIREASSRYPDCRDDLALLQSLPPEEASVAAPFYAWLRLNPTDVVHTWQDSINIAGGMAAVMAGVPKVVLATRSTRPDSRRRLRRTLVPGYKALLNHPTVSILNNSESGARDYEDWLGLKEGTIHTLHNGMDIENMRDRANPQAIRKVRSKLGFPDGALVLGGVMRFTEEKRPELFIHVAMNAARRDPRLHFVLIGAGPMRAGLMEEVELAGLSSQIVFPGRQNPIEPWMASFDMLFLSSRMEGLPNVLLEAQCVGTPVATMKVGGAPETLEDGETGILIDETNPDVIASIILEKLYDEKWRAEASVKGRERIEALFSIEAMAEKTRALYIS